MILLAKVNMNFSRFYNQHQQLLAQQQTDGGKAPPQTASSGKRNKKGKDSYLSQVGFCF